MNATRGRLILHSSLFFLLLLAIAFKLDYPQILNKGPQSIHAWRQADCASQAWNYYDKGMQFFQPAVVNIQNGSGAAASEFPLIYYLAALGYQIFGVQDGLLRGLNFFFFVLGLFSFSRLLLLLLDDWLLALGIPLLLFGSPALAFYSFNFLPNTSALGMVLLGVAFYGFYLHRKRERDYYLAIAGFSLAGLLKITLLVPFLAGLGAYILRQIWPSSGTAQFSLFPSRRKMLLASLLILGLPFLWVFWAKTYNLEHQSGIFLTGILPIWEMDAAAIRETLGILRGTNAYFFTPASCFVLLGMLIFSLIFHKKIRREIWWILALLILGNIAYLLLFFQQLAIHNYYFLDLMLLPLVIFSLFIYILYSFQLGRWWPWGLGLAVLLFVNTNLNSASAYVRDAYRAQHIAMQSLNPAFYKTEALQKAMLGGGITAEAKLISIPDKSPNLSLYYLRRRGWTEIFNEGQWPQKLAELRSKGAQYLVISDAGYPLARKLSEELAAPVLVFEESIYFYRLD